MNMRLLSIGRNSKLGAGVASFNLPAGPTCPGATAICREICYAKSGRMILPQQKERYLANLKATLQEDFVDRMVQEIKTNGVSTIRIHAAGDVNTPGYARKWIAVKKRCPKVEMFLYTRSWRIPKLLPALEEMRAAGIVVYASLDDYTAEPPPEGWPVAYMGEQGFQNVGIVCPQQTSQGKVTCASCRWCIEGKGDVTFIPHGAGRNPMKRLLEIAR